MPEPDASQGQLFPTGSSSQPKQGVIKNSGDVSADIPHVKSLTDAIASLTSAWSGLTGAMNNVDGKKIAAQYKVIEDQIKETDTAAKALHGTLSTSTPAATASSGSTFGGAHMPPPSATMDSSTGGGPSSMAYSGGAFSRMSQSYSGAGGGLGGVLAGAGSGLLSGLNSAADIIGAVSSAGVQFVNNRIEGPTGNRDATIQMSQALAPLATMMGLKIDDAIKGFAQRSPVQGSQADILGTALAGNDVGAQLKGTPGRNGFFQGVREMQALTPGVGAAQLAGTLGGYMQNTKSQQMGIMYGGGAFSMMGQGGKFKSLGEWAVGITKYLEQQRPGSKRGKPFTAAELLAQNFPGSNFNAWFQMMGVPGDMVSYWWQYVMTKAQTGASDQGSLGEETGLATQVKKQRGNDLGAQRLDTVTQSSRRDFLMGTQMYPVYGVKEAADKRFNVAMQKADLDIGQMATQTKVGQFMSQLPTPISDLVMPLLTKLAGSKLGSAAAVGSMLGLLGDPDPIGDIGDYGSQGQTGTAHLAPGLAQKIQMMQRANPNLRVTSGMRDTSTQNRLQRQGVGRVGQATRSKHTRGWAADMGPRSQLGWLNANAHKFGLQTASSQGEPWHVQQAGTMPVGDPTPIGDILGSLGSAASTAGNIASDAVGVLTDPGGLIKKAIQKLLGGDGSTSDDIDAAINMFIKVMLSPTMALSKVFGSSKFDQKSADDIINKPHSFAINYGKYQGFKSASDPSGGNVVFGDPGSNYPQMGNNVSIRPIVITNHITVQGGMGSRMDAQRTAGVLAGHIESELSRRMDRVS